MQERSKKRREAIFDAAAIEFADVGFEGARVEAIAARAKTSVGSLYQFFPDKSALFRALAERCVTRSRIAFEAMLAHADRSRHWTELLDATVDGFALLHQSDPAFRAVLVNLQLYGLYAEADQTLHRFIVGKVAREIGVIAPRVTRTRRERIASVMVASITAALFLVHHASEAEAKGILAETKVMLRSYVGNVITVSSRT